MRSNQIGTSVAPAVYTVKEVCTLLGLQKSTAYLAISRGEIPSVRFGTSIRVPRAAVERMLEVPQQKSA
ncbi:helix-turn-helix domain-containing protein [Mesorhizobium sp. M0136]|uniref:helix-turn-helix domain-containing protein n=1 Tax=Mesorhizobium sp. M0136 TaxID=2956890 RepID=UPI0033355637